MLGDLWQDLRYARRTLAAKPAFTLVAILSLALGIGANTALFSLWNGVLRASLPGVRNPHELVMLSSPDHAGGWTGHVDGVRQWLTYQEFEDLRDRADRFSAVMASQSSLSSWQVRVDGGGWQEASGRLVSGGFFEVLGVGPALGRLFTPADDRAGNPHAVVSYTYWQRRFGGRPDVVGKTLTIRKAVLTIVGVAPRGFIGETVGQQPDFWLPLRTQPSVIPGMDRLHDTPPTKAMWLHVFGRLKPGVTPAQADAQANAIFQAGLETFYGAAASGERRRELLNQRLQIQSADRGASYARRELSQSLTALLVAVGVLLLIACANLANLLLARGAARQTELAVRASLGASRARLLRQLVTESVALAAIGGAAAVAIASMLHGVLVGMLAESDSDFRVAFAIDPTVLGFVLLATLAATLVFGVLPAWQVTKTDVGVGLREQSRGAIGRAGQVRSGRVLVSLQLALSLPLLVGAGLLARTVYNLQRTDLGFPVERLLLVRVDTREAGYEGERRVELLRTLTGEIQRIPGVSAVSFSQLGVFSGGESLTSLDVEGYTPTGERDRGSALDVVGPRYFATLGVPVVLGRDVQESDRAGTPTIAVVNEAFAKRFFSGRNPIGRRLTAVRDADRPTYQIVGVVKDTRTQALRGEIEPRYFVAAAQPPSAVSSPTLLIRTSGEASAVMTTVRKTIERVNAALPIVSATTLEQQMAPLTAQERTTAQLAVIFGLVAMTLAALGLYGVLSYGVARRRGEIAIRIALGAQPGRLVSMILGETVVTVCVGLAVGAALAVGESRLIGSRLYGVAAHDPLTLLVATAVLLTVALIAAYLPARRASRLDPIAALHQG